MKHLAVRLWASAVALVVGVGLMAGCAGIEGAPQPDATAAATTIEPVEARPEPAAMPPTAPAGAAPMVAAPARPAALPRPAAALPKPQAQTPLPAAKPAAPPSVAAPAIVPPAVKPAATVPLDLKSLEARLKETKAIGVFSKLVLKNQIDDLLERFRAFYQGRAKTSLAELRRAFDTLVTKTLALLQDADPPLASALASSCESIWGILSDRAKFATL
jgi:hypothetical protein